MRVLVPDTHAPVDLDELYAHAEGLVRANFVSTLDGAVHDSSGVSGGLSSPADKRVFGALRANCDVVLVGAGTVRKEGYGPAKPNSDRQRVRRARGQAAVPPIAVVSRSLDLDLESAFFTEAKARPIVVTVEGASIDDRMRVGDIADVVVAGDEDVDVAAALDELAARGLTRVLCEGGPHLLTDLAAAGRLDELCLTVKLAVVGGDSGRLVSGPAIHGWEGETQHVLLDGHHLFLRVARH
jgi:riboflavin biosynthesis pyrimidine reductase